MRSAATFGLIGKRIIGFLATALRQFSLAGSNRICLISFQIFLQGITQMDQRQIERFVDVVDSGSLTRTSRRLNISQPALSKSLRLLEEQLGTKLLERGPRGVRVTKSGGIFCQRARTIPAEFRRARED